MSNVNSQKKTKPTTRGSYRRHRSARQILMRGPCAPVCSFLAQIKSPRLSWLCVRCAQPRYYYEKCVSVARWRCPYLSTSVRVSSTADIFYYISCCDTPTLMARDLCAIWAPCATPEGWPVAPFFKKSRLLLQEEIKKKPVQNWAPEDRTKKKTHFFIHFENLHYKKNNQWRKLLLQLSAIKQKSPNWCVY